MGYLLKKGGEKNMLTLKNINIEYEQPVLYVKNLNLCHGNIYGFIGASGSGKSSLLDCIALDNKNFDLYDNGTLVHDYALYKHEHIFYINQKDMYLDHLTFLEHIKLLTSNIPDDDLKERFLIDFDLNNYPDHLSGGEKQRFGLLLGYLKNADILIVDEISASLDTNTSLKVVELLQELAYQEGKMIVLVTHDSILKECCDVVYEIKSHQLELVKNEAKTERKFNYKSIKYNKLLKKLVLPQYKARKGVRKFLLVISVLMLTLGIIGIDYAASYYTHVEHTQQLLNSQQNFVYPENNYLSSTDIETLHSTSNIISFFETSSQIEKYYPFYYFFVSNEFNDVYDVVKADRTIESNLFNFEVSHQNQKYTISPKLYSDNIKYDIYPYYPETHLNSKCTQLVSGEGIYISSLFAQMLNINQLDEETYITLEFLVPVLNLEFEYGNSEYENETTTLFWDTVKDTFKVKGILDGQYNVINSNHLFYMDYQLFEDYANKARNRFKEVTTMNLSFSSTYQDQKNNWMKEEYFNQLVNDLKLDQNTLTITNHSFEPTKYTIFTSSDVSFETLTTEIAKADHFYKILNSSNRFHEARYLVDQRHSYMIIGSCFFIGLILCYSVYTGFTDLKQRQKEFNILRNLGFKVNDLKKYIYDDVLFITLIHIIGAGLLYFAYNVYGYYSIRIFESYGKNTVVLMTLMILLIVSLIISVLRNLMSYREIIKNDKN